MFCYCYFTGKKRWYKEPQGGCDNGESRWEGELRGVAACTWGGHVSPCKTPVNWEKWETRGTRASGTGLPLFERSNTPAGLGATVSGCGVEGGNRETRWGLLLCST